MYTVAGWLQCSLVQCNEKFSEKTLLASDNGGLDQHIVALLKKKKKTTLASYTVTFPLLCFLGQVQNLEAAKIRAAEDY